jgi:MerR-like DNA binding protein
MQEEVVESAWEAAYDRGCNISRADIRAILEAALTFPQFLTTSQVAKAYKVDPRTVVRWGDNGYFTVHRTPGGHRRYLEDEIRSKLKNGYPKE